VRTWTDQICDLRTKLIEMRRGYRQDPTSVTATDWTEIVGSQERKLQFIYGHKHSRENWPKGVLYLTMFALTEHRKKTKAATTQKTEAATLSGMKAATTSRFSTLREKDIPADRIIPTTALRS
jgi:hypothetical protein